MMKIYLISQNVNRGYDTYSDAVVCAESEDEARHIHPSDISYHWDNMSSKWSTERGFDVLDDWASPDDVEVKLIGKAEKGLNKSIICSSYHAG